MSVTLEKAPRLYAVTLWTGETRTVWAHDAQDAAASSLSLVPTDPQTGRGHRVLPGEEGDWLVTFAGDEGTQTVATVAPLSWEEVPFRDEDVLRDEDVVSWLLYGREAIVSVRLPWRPTPEQVRTLDTLEDLSDVRMTATVDGPHGSYLALYGSDGRQVGALVRTA